MGAPLARFAHEATATVGLYRISPPAPPERPFETVLVVATRDEGVCAVIMVTPRRSFDGGGAGAKAIFAHTERVLSHEYGTAIRRDRLAPASVLKEPSDYAAALAAGQRELRADWGTLATPVISGEVAAVRLEARAPDADTTYVRLTYQFRNYDRCRATIDAVAQARRLLGR
jgi:hypothetical protein